MPRIGANFQFTSTEPNFERDQFATKAAMKAVTVIDDGHISFCKEDNKRYEFLSSNSVDPTLGKWREFKAGGDAPDLTPYVKTADLSLTGSGLSYTLKVGSQTIGTISIPKDQFLKSAGYDQSTHILTLVFETTTGEKTETIDLSNLVDTYTKGNGITITNHTIAIDPTVVATKTDINGLNTALSGKQDTITDLSTIRDGASKGATALQEHQSLAGYATETWVQNKSYATQSWVESKGYLTQHQDISGKQDKLTEGDGISISEDNVISLTEEREVTVSGATPTINLSDYLVSTYITCSTPLTSLIINGENGNEISLRFTVALSVEGGLPITLPEGCKLMDDPANFIAEADGEYELSIRHNIAVLAEVCEPQYTEAYYNGDIDL